MSIYGIYRLYWKQKVPVLWHLLGRQVRTQYVTGRKYFLLHVDPNLSFGRWCLDFQVELHLKLS